MADEVIEQFIAAHPDAATEDAASEDAAEASTGESAEAAVGA
jgi:hypothetical protein